MKPRKPYTTMNAAELAEATAQYDVPGFHPRALKPPAAEKKRHDRILKAIKRRRTAIAE